MSFFEKLSNVAASVVKNKPAYAVEFEKFGFLDPMKLMTDGDKESFKFRLERYAIMRKCYRGDYLGSIPLRTTAEQASVIVNWNRALINKSVTWLASPGWTLLAKDDKHKEIADKVNLVLQRGAENERFWRGAHDGAIAGDCYMVVSKDVVGKTKQSEFDKAPWKFRFHRPERVNVLYDPMDNEVVTAAIIQTPVRVSKRFAELAGREQFYTQDADYVVHTQIITDDRIAEYINNVEDRVYNNPYKGINVFHVQNLMTGSSAFGESDILDVTSLTAFNDGLRDIGLTACENHADPTTVIIGARATQLERGGGNLWSIKNDKAHVHNLEMKEDMGALFKFIEQMQAQIHQLSGIPAASMGTGDLSGITEFGITILFLPLIEKTRCKRITYGNGIRRAAAFIANRIGGKDLSMDDFDVVWASPLPKDEDKAVERKQRAVEAGLESESSALKELYPSSFKERAEEILADRRSHLLTDSERARASEGGVPALRAVDVSSLGHLVDNPDRFNDSDKLVATMLAIVSKAQEKEKEVEEVEEPRVLGSDGKPMQEKE